MTEFRPGSFQVIPTIIKNLIIVNALVFLAQNVFEHNIYFNIESWFALHDVRSMYFRPHQIVTYMFLHGSISHIFWNMFMLWMFGSILENYWGPKRFLVFYTVCGIGAALLHLVVLRHELAGSEYADVSRFSPADQHFLIESLKSPLNSPTLGASGAIFGCMIAFGLLFPNSLIYMYFLFPIKVKWFVLGYVLIELFAGISNTAGDNVAHWAHLGGGLAGLLLVLFWRKTDRRNFY